MNGLYGKKPIAKTRIATGIRRFDKASGNQEIFVIMATTAAAVATLRLMSYDMLKLLQSRRATTLIYMEDPLTNLEGRRGAFPRLS